MSAEERDLLAAECPRPDTYNRMLFLCRAFCAANGHTPYSFTRISVDMAWKNDQEKLYRDFKNLWSRFSVFQREEILVAWTIEVLS